MLNNKSSPKKLKHKFLKTKTYQNPISSLQIRILAQEERNTGDEKGNYNRREGSITNAKEVRLEKSKVRNRKDEWIIKNVPTDKIAELNDLIHAGAEVFSEKLGILQKRKSERKFTKERKTCKDTMEWNNWEKTAAEAAAATEKTNNTTGRNKPQPKKKKKKKKKWLKKGNSEDTGTGSNNAIKTEHSKITKIKFIKSIEKA